MMAAAPQEWLESSFALLERLESERDGLASALEELDRRLDNLHRGADRASVELGDMHHEHRQIEDMRRALARQADELEAAQARLWDKLTSLQREREAIKDAESDLLERVTALESREGMLPRRYQQTQAEKQKLEDEIASASRTREDIARELESLNAEMTHMIRALEAVAEDSDPDEDHETRVAHSPLRLVGSGPPPLRSSRSGGTQPPPLPGGRRKLPPTELIHPHGGGSRPRVSPTLPMMPSAPAMLPLRGNVAASLPGREELPTTRHNVVPLREPAFPAIMPPAFDAIAHPPAQTVPPTHAMAHAMAHAVAQTVPAPQRFSAPVPAAMEDDWLEQEEEQERRARRTRRRLWLGIVTATAALVGLSVQVIPQTAVWPEIEPSVVDARNSMVAMVDHTPAAEWLPASWRGAAPKNAPAMGAAPDESSSAIRSAGIAPPPPPAPVAGDRDPADPAAMTGEAEPAAQQNPETPSADAAVPTTAPVEEPDAAAGAAAPDVAPEAEPEAEPEKDTAEPEPETAPEETERAKPASAAKASKRSASKTSSRAKSKKAAKTRRSTPSKAKPESKPKSESKAAASTPEPDFASTMPKKRKNGVSVANSSDPLSGL